jgi:2',3'-cyclic-nucleotide 2'-phosphodiesterase (5'-nucleotidase family)
VARWAAFINRQKNPDASWLTVDAGDYVDRGVSGGCTSKCQFMVTSYEDLHYDVLNIGKQEVLMGYETLDSLIRATKAAKGTQFVSANLINVKTKRPLTTPTVIKDYGHFRVGLIGLLAESDFPRGSSLLDSTRLAVTPMMDAAKKYLPSLIRKTDAVVVLGELTSGQIDTLCKAYPQIAVVISVGAVKTGELPSMSGKTRVLGTGSQGSNGHYATLEFNPVWKDSVGFVQFQDPLSDTYEEKGLWADKVTAFNAMPVTPQPVKTASPSGNPALNSIPALPKPGTSSTPDGKQVPPSTGTSATPSKG